MKIIRYRPFSHSVKVGVGYNPRFRGKNYCFDAGQRDWGFCVPLGDLETMMISLRLQRIEPFQIDNIETSTPFQTEPLSEENYYLLRRGLSRPAIVVVGLPGYKKTGEAEVDTKRKFAIDIDPLAEPDIMDLDQLLTILNIFGSTKDDLQLLEQNEFSYFSLEEKYRNYILGALDKKNKR
ncbi:MAG: hypothetical protein Q7S27_00070 [Nanoarchaeota archaeon]|nr:hypothetical protein [Nanoarchaeota archaeon]